MTWLDGYIINYFLFTPAYTPDEGFIETPLLGDSFKALNCVFIPRGGSKEKVDKTLNILKER